MEKVTLIVIVSAEHCKMKVDSVALEKKNVIALSMFLFNYYFVYYSMFFQSLLLEFNRNNKFHISLFFFLLELVLGIFHDWENKMKFNFLF